MGGTVDSMKQRHADARVVPFPKYQRLAAFTYRTVRYKSIIHGLLEVDVTAPRAALHAHKAATGESLSFTAFLATCVAKAVDEHKAMQAFRQGRKHLILFEDVDIATRIEHEVAGQKRVVVYILRAANRKTCRQLNDEIRAAQHADVKNTLMRFQFWPDTLFGVFVWAIEKIGVQRPRLWKELLGTVGLTSVGMFVSGGGWGIPTALPTALMLTVGGIGEKQVIVDGRLTVREYLDLTISVDHDLVDGGPATRFTQRLKALIESGYGLGDLMDTGSPSQAAAHAALP